MKEEPFAGAARRIRAVVTDVDGVLTDGCMYYSESGDELKKFNVRDGVGTALLRSAGIMLGAVTGESNELIVRRLRKLQFDFALLGARDKHRALTEYSAGRGIELAEIAYLGDEVNDCGLLRKVGIFFGVADACEPIKKAADYLLRRKGGEGALEELAEVLLAARGQYQSCLESYWKALGIEPVEPAQVIEF